MSFKLRTVEIGICVLCLLVAFAFGAAALSMPFGTVSTPGPAFIPLILAAVLGAASIAKIITASVGPGARLPTELVDIPLKWEMLAVLGSLTGAAFLLEPIGYLPTAVLFLFVLLKALSPLSGWRCLFAAGLGGLVSLLIFRDLLAVNLPPIPFDLPF